MLRGIHLPWNFSWVDEKKLAGTSVPTTEVQMKALVSEGVSHLVSLSPETPPFTAGPVEGLKITYIDVEDFDAPTPKQIRKFLKVCESADARGEAVAVHCRGGRGRTGTVGSKTFQYFQRQQFSTKLYTLQYVLCSRCWQPTSCARRAWTRGQRSTW